MTEATEAEGRTGTNGGAPEEGLAAGYSEHEHRPLAGYSVLSATFLAGAIGSLIAARRAGHEPPERFGPWDVITAGAATHKLSRLITKGKSTSPVRAPFVRYEDSAGQGEVSERPRGRGLRLAVGELLTCPYCVGQWVSGAFAVGMVAAPRATRVVGFLYTAETVADFLQLAYRAAEDRA